MSHGVEPVSGRGGQLSLGGCCTSGFGESYFQAVGEYLRTTRGLSGGDTGGCRDVSELVEGWSRIAGTVLFGCCGGAHAGVPGFECCRDGFEALVRPAGAVEAPLPSVAVEGEASGLRDEGFVSCPTRGSSATGGCGVDGLGERCEVRESVSECKGKQWWKNQKRSKKRKMASMSWRQNARPLVDGSGGCVSSESDCGSVATVDTRTAVEIEASQTLAARRVAENKYEIARLEAKTRSFSDKSKTEALAKLEAARMEQRINQAIARSQKAYGETDRSLKSLGSTGSAGEFALKKEVKRGEEARIERDYLKEQVGKMLRFVPASVKEEIANMKPPVFPTDEEVFGDCPDSWSDTEKMDYYDEQVRHDEELAARSFDHRIIREPENVVFSPALQEDMRRLRDLTVFE